jgi:Bacterial Ig-like domain (group 3)/NHL repeat
MFIAPTKRARSLSAIFPFAAYSSVSLLISLFFFTPKLFAQATGPILVVQPSASVHITAGVGVSGFSGDSGPAKLASLSGPTQIVADAAGNLYFADRKNNRVRKIDASGNISTVAGSAFQGFAGDYGPAISAMLSAPDGVALDPAGNLYIADTANHRIRKVSTGIITTVAGNGTPGFCGEGYVATAACLSWPRGVAVDGSGNIWIADTDNQRVRVVMGGIMYTYAGTGVQGDSGDYGPATSAQLNLPSTVTADSAGNIYVTDSGNNRVRVMNNGIIKPFAGTGNPVYSGDGDQAVTAGMSFPYSARPDPWGKVIVSDTNDNVFRLVTQGVISTIAGTDFEGPAIGSGGPLSAIFNRPFDTAPDITGFYLTDFDNQLIRRVNYAALDFGNLTVGRVSDTKPIVLSNSGGAPVVVSSFSLPGSVFTITTDGSCPRSFPFSIAPSTSCTINVRFSPVQSGIFGQQASIVDNAPGSPHTVLAAGVGVLNPTTLQLTAQPPAVTYGATLSLTATLTPPAASDAPPRAGQISFLDGASVISTQAVSQDQAQISPNLLPVGTQVITASYSGDPAYSASSASATVTIAKATPTVAITSLPSPIAVGFPLTLNASVQYTAGAPTGLVNFVDGATNLGAATLDSSGNASVNVASLASGPHSIRADYSGDPNFNSAQSAPLGSTGASFRISASVKNSSGFSNTIEVDLTPLNGFNGTVVLSCSSLPTNATCAFNPSKVSFSTSSAASSSLTLNMSQDCSNPTRFSNPALRP